MGYLYRIQELQDEAHFYNALTRNCTTSFLPYINAVYDLEFNWTMLANGYIDRWHYNDGVWGFDIPFEEFRETVFAFRLPRIILSALDLDLFSVMGSRSWTTESLM